MIRTWFQASPSLLGFLKCLITQLSNLFLLVKWCCVAGMLIRVNTQWPQLTCGPYTANCVYTICMHVHILMCMHNCICLGSLSRHTWSAGSRTVWWPCKTGPECLVNVIYTCPRGRMCNTFLPTDLVVKILYSNVVQRQTADREFNAPKRKLHSWENEGFKLWRHSLICTRSQCIFARIPESNHTWCFCKRHQPVQIRKTFSKIFKFKKKSQNLLSWNNPLSYSI